MVDWRKKLKSSFAIAYSNQDGRDFNGIPWILDDLNNENECMSKALEMITDGFQNVIPFQFEQKEKRMKNSIGNM